MYTKEKHLALEKIAAEMSDNDDLPRNFDYTVTILTDSSMSFYTKHAFKHHPPNDKSSLDEKMMLYYPEQYGDGIPWAEEGKLFWAGILKHFLILSILANFHYIIHYSFLERKFPFLVVYFQWANVYGNEEKFGDDEAAWFEKVREAMGGEEQILDAPEINTEEADPHAVLFNLMKCFLKDPDAQPYTRAHYTVPTPLSECMRYWAFEDVREFVQPYEKRTYMSDKSDLSTNGYAEWVADRVDLIASNYIFDERVNLQLQVQPIGGKNSMYRRNGEENPQDSCHSWRTESRLNLIGLDSFYAPENDEVFQIVKQWIIENDEACCEEGGIFSEKDRRVLWGCFSRFNDPDCGASLDSVWDKYFDSREKYDKLIEIKRRVDPNYLFTANAFGVDASNAPLKKRCLILRNGRDHSSDSSDSTDSSDS